MPHVGYTLRTDSKQGRQFAGNEPQTDEHADVAFFCVEVVMVEQLHQWSVVVDNELGQFMPVAFGGHLST